MPVLGDLMDHELLGPAIRKGRKEGESRVLLTLIRARFGTVPAWAESRLNSLDLDQLDALALRILSAQTIEDLFA